MDWELAMLELNSLDEVAHPEAKHASALGSEAPGRHAQKGYATPSRLRPSNDGRQVGPNRCQVEGCNEDLTNLKRYHKRHRVCDLHLRATRVRISGVFQRFCQKCSRFQEVQEFDGDRRSCRETLLLHNSRRRKGAGKGEQKPGASSVEDIQAGTGSPIGKSSHDEGTGHLAGQDVETIGCRDDACSIASSIAYGSLEDNTSACDEMMECVNNGALGQKRMPGKSTTMPHLNTIAATVRAHGCIPELQGLSTLASLGFNEMMSPSQEAAARFMLVARGKQAVHSPTVLAVHICIRLFGIRLDDLPEEVQSDVVCILPGVLEFSGYEHNSWVHVSLDIIQDAGHARRTQQMGARGLVAELIRQGSNFWRRMTWMAQLGHETVSVAEGSVMAFQDRVNLGSTLSSLVALCPAAISSVGQQGVEMHIHPSADARLQPHLFAAVARSAGHVIPMTLKAVAGNDPSDFVLSWLVADSVRCGVMHIEGIENMTATNTKPLLITDNPALEKELQFASQSMPWVDPFFEEIGILLSFNGSMQGQVSGSAITWVMPSFHSLLVDVACNILVFAVEKGWPWIASTAMEALTGGGEHPSAVMASLEQRLEGQGTLLHLAVCSQEPAIVRWLLGWGQANGVAWDIHRPTAKGVSVLMLAKALPDPLISMELAEYMLKLERTVSEGSTRSDSEQNPASPTGSQPRAHSAQNGSASERGHHRRASSGRGVFKSSSRKNLINRHRSHSFRSGQGERSALAGFPQASSPAQTDDQLTSMSSVMRHGGNCSAIPNTGSSRLNLAVDPDMMYAPLDIFSLTRIEFPGPSAGPISQFEDRGFVAGKPEDIMQLGAAASILGRRGPPSSRHTWGSQAFHTYGGSARHLGS